MSEESEQKKGLLAQVRRDGMMERFAAFAMQHLIRIQKVPGGKQATCDTGAAWRIAKAMTDTFDQMRKDGLICWIIIALVLSAVTARAAWVMCWSASYSDVSRSYQTCRSGDTLFIPAGRATWNNYLVVNKPLNIVGQGSNATVIVNGGIIPTVQGVKVSGIRFQ